MSDSVHGNISLVRFFLLTFLLSLPLYVLGPNALGLLTFIILVEITPITAALVLTYLDPKSSVRELLKRYATSVKIPKIIWYIPIFFLMPVMWLLGNLLLSLFVDVPEIIYSITQLPLIIFSIIMSSMEEIGWMGYAYDAMEEKWQTLKSTLILGIMWAIWHVPLFYLAGNSAMWILVMSINFLAWRTLIVWIYKNTRRSIFAVSVFHATGSYTSTILLYMSEPGGGILGIIAATAITIITALIVVALGKLNQ